MSCNPRSVGALCGAVLAALAGLGEARADGAPSVVTPGTGGQNPLVVGLDDKNQLRAALCVGTACAVAGNPSSLDALRSGQALEVPPLRDRSTLKLQVVAIGKQRHVVVARIPGPSVGQIWEAVLAAVPGQTQPKILFQGNTGFVKGEYGERAGPMLLVAEPDKDGQQRVVIGEQREDITLCGRPTVLAPQLIVPDDVALHPAKVQRLLAEERRGAPRLQAELNPAGISPSVPGLLRATAASSAIGSPSALTDGNPATAWAENRGSDGRGEFVTMVVPSALPLAGLDLVIRPTTSASPQAVAPRELWIAASGSTLFHVTVPADAWEHPGQAYSVQFPSPITTDCLSLVTEAAQYPGSDSRKDAVRPTGPVRPSRPVARPDKEVDVTVAEVSARPATGGKTVEQLVAQLNEEPGLAEGAGALVRALGEPAWRAVAKSYWDLTEGGRRVALDVMDDAPCEISARVYVKALVSQYEAHRIHAKARMGRCGGAAAAALIKQLDRGLHPENALRVADQLAAVAPAEAIRALVPRLRGASAVQRNVLRIALARAAHRPESLSAIREALRDRELDSAAALDFLRALGPELQRSLPESGAAFSALAAPEASFRTRYLLLEPAAELSQSWAPARAYLAQRLSRDPSPHIRAQAVQWVRGPQAPIPQLITLLQDTDVRVREATARKLGELRAGGAAIPLMQRLDQDDWPLVRSASAVALTQLGPSEAIDEALKDALSDDSGEVKSLAITGLGQRKVVGAAKAIRRRLRDEREPAQVRLAAANALGQLCDNEATDLLTSYAVRLVDPLDPSDAKQVAPAAVAALGRLHPADLAQRLAPLLSPKAPRLAQSLARESLGREGTCNPGTRSTRRHAQ